MLSETAERMLSVLQQRGYSHFTGVPCSLLKGIFRQLEARTAESGSGITYVPAVREDSALGVASGMYLGGKKSVVLMQNSGLGYSLNVLTSFNLIYDLPVLLLISWRGAYGNDAVEHDIIGARLTNVLEAIDIAHVVFNPDQVEGSIGQAIDRLEATNRPVAVLIKNEV